MSGSQPLGGCRNSALIVAVLRPTELVRRFCRTWRGNVGGAKRPNRRPARTDAARRTVRGKPPDARRRHPYLAIAAICCAATSRSKAIPERAVVGRGYERRNLRLPLTIEDALERMENSKTIEKYLGQKFITGYVAVKRAEHENFKRVISSWEREFLLFAV